MCAVGVFHDASASFVVVAELVNPVVNASERDAVQSAQLEHAVASGLEVLDDGFLERSSKASLFVEEFGLCVHVETG